jgi:hypothetical protein
MDEYPEITYSVNIVSLLLWMLVDAFYEKKEFQWEGLSELYYISK